MKKISHSLQLLCAVMLLLGFHSALKADPIYLSNAKTIASRFVTAGAEPVLVKGNGVKKIRQRSINGQLTQNYYVFSRGVGEGFVIVSGNDALPEVIGYTDNGDFDYDQMPPALQDMISYYAAAADSINELAISSPASQPKKVVRKAAGTHNIATLMTSHWHQSWPYNNLCPHLTSNGSTAATGCVATAASQIIYYWRKNCNTYSQYATPTYSYGDAPASSEYQIPKNTPFKWDLMKDSYGSGDDSEHTTAAATVVACTGMSAWLTYGSSTSGQIDNCRNVFSSQFGLNGGVTVWKSSYGQTAWEKLIVSDLELGRPILYSGVHPTSGGHAVVVDGYNYQSNLFHFNFGWGGQGDGYYTVDDATGMNGFCQGQGMVYQIYGRPKLKVELLYAPDTLLLKAYNTVRYRITNLGRQDVSGFYLYANSSQPSSSTVVQDKDEETVLSAGETKEFTFQCKPSAANANLYLTYGKAGTTLLISKLEKKSTQSQMTFNGFDVADGGDVESVTLGDETVVVHNVYNTKKVDVTAHMTNGVAATTCLPSVPAAYAKYNADEQTFEKASSKYSTGDVTFQPGESADVTFNMTGLTENTIYRISMKPVIYTPAKDSIRFATTDTVIYLRMMGADIDTVRTGNILTVKGHYNAKTFATVSDDATITAYDLTQLQGISGTLSAANVNALFYVDASQQVAGRNIVADNVCDQLELTPGYDFNPKDDFRALNATYHATQGVANYGSMLLPFDADVPNGMFVHAVDSLTASRYTCKEPKMEHIEAGVPCMFLSGRPKDITAQQVDVSVKESKQIVSTNGKKWFAGVYCNTFASDSTLLLDDTETGDAQYFQPVDSGSTIPALTAYLHGFTSKVNALSSSNSAVEKKSRILAQTIVTAIETLNYDAVYTTLEAQKALIKAIEDAEDSLYAQPELASLTQTVTDLEAAITAYENSYAKKTAEGYLDMTYLITNPSFENKATGWERSSTISVSPTALNTTTNYMSGIDGTEFMWIKKPEQSLIQKITNVPNGTYQLVFSASLDYNTSASICVETKGHFITKVFDTSDFGINFGPYYFHDLCVDDIVVSDNNLNIYVLSGDSWLKVENFRLYQKSKDDTETSVEPINNRVSTKAAANGIFDLSGRRVVNPQNGIYIKDGKKVIK